MKRAPGDGQSYLLVAMVVALVGGGGLIASSGRSQPLPNSGAGKGGGAGAERDRTTASESHGRRDALSVLESFAGTDKGGVAADPTKRAMELQQSLLALGYQSARVLLATVPDPNDSRFTKPFDDQVGAMRIAFERSGFINDRFVDPWHAGAGSSGKIYREQPGVMLFRREATKDIVVLLLIGETPNRGIHRRALGAALDFSSAMAAGGCQTAPPKSEGTRPIRYTLPILGPAMSGTAESLRSTIVRWFARQWKEQPAGGPCRLSSDPPFDLEFISGTATSDENRESLGKQLTSDVRAYFPDFVSSFAATVHPDSEQQAFVVDYLADTLSFRRIALLAESSTSYGLTFTESANTARAVRRVGGDLRLIDLPFPVHVSKLRIEDSTPVAGDAEQSEPNQDDGEIEEDAFPTKSHTTQATSEISLSQTLRAIATEDVEAVIIVASSTSDVLFLVDRVRRSFPNVTIVVNDADLIYLKGDVLLEGVLVASTYPLLPWAQRITFPFEGDETLLMFPSSGAQGVYNATLLLLDDLTTANLLDYGTPFVVPAGGFGPALWMSVVSHGAFWPITIHPNAGGTYVQSREAVTDAFDREAIDRTIWTLPYSVPLLIGNCVLVGLNVILIFGYAWRKRSVLPASVPGRAAAPPRAFPHQHMERFEVATLFLIAAILDAAFWGVGFVTTLPAPADTNVARVAVLALLGISSLGVVFCTVLAFIEWISKKEHPWKSTWVPTAALGAVLVSVLAVAPIVPRLRALQETHSANEHVARFMFFIERARSLDSGVSLLWIAALLGTGLALWILGHLRQARIVEDARALRRYGVIPTTKAETETAEPLAVAERLPGGAMSFTKPLRDAAREAEGVWPTSGGLILMGLVFFASLWISRRLVFFEVSAWGFFCAVAYATLLSFIVYGCSRYLRTWRALEDLLARVAPLPLAAALDRIPIDLLTSFKRPWDSQVFEVWQRHCQVVFAKLNSDPKLLDATSLALSAEIDQLLPLLSIAPATQIGVPVTALPSPITDAEWAPLWEDFLAMRLVAFVQYIRTHLANFVAVSTAALLPAFWATNFYPLSENRFLLGLVLLVAGAAIAVMAVVFVQMNRNYVLSKFDHTSPGHVTWDRSFVSSLLVHVALPLVALLAVKFPELGRAWQLLTAAIAAAPNG
jgi:hypothetical protein